MVWDDDFCACKECEQKWELHEKGWEPILGLNARTGGSPPPRRPMRPTVRKKGLNRARKRS